MKLQCCVLAVFGIFISGLQADEIDELVQARMKELQVPGAALAILRDGRLEKEAYYGQSVVEHNVPVSNDTVFRLASVTKAVTTVAVLKLYESGELDLDDSVTKHLATVPEHWNAITVRHLLSQTSGIQTPDEAFSRTIQEDQEEFVKFFWTLYIKEFLQLEPAKKSPLQHAPGEGWAYNNTHHAFAGKILQSVSGVTLNEFVRREIFAPLEMSSATFKIGGHIIHNEAKGYRLGRNSKKLRTAFPFSSSVSSIPGHAGMYCTLRDLVKLEMALHAGRILKPETRDLMWQLAITDSGQPAPVKWFDGHTDTGYGMGWFVDGTNEHPWVFVPGSSGTVWVRLPKDGITIIWLSNLERQGQDIGRRDLVNLLVPELKGHTF